MLPDDEPFDDDALDDETFPPNFAIAPGALPSGEPRRVFYYPGATTSGGKDGLILTLTPIGQAPWTGVFAGGPGVSEEDASRRVVTLPGGERFFVACDGAGYIVRADDPGDWSEVACWPVRIIRVVPSHELLLLGDFTDFVAYGRDGLQWRSQRLAWDDLSLIAIRDDRLVASGWHLGMDRVAEFEVELATGNSVGQPYP